MPKNRRQKDNEKFRSWVAGLYGASMSVAPQCGEDADKRERLPLSFTTEPRHTMIIYVQSDISFEEVDTSVLRPQKGKPSDGQDRERIAEWLFKRERRKNNSVVAAVGRDEVCHVRSHFGVNKADL